MTRSSVHSVHSDHSVDGWPTRRERVLAAARWKPVGCAFKTGGRSESAQTFPPGWLAQPGVGYMLGLQADLVLPLCTKVAPHAKMVAEVPAAAKGAVGRVMRGHQVRQANAALHEPGRLPVCKTVTSHGHHAQLGVVAARRGCCRRSPVAQIHIQVRADAPLPPRILQGHAQAQSACAHGRTAVVGIPGLHIERSGLRGCLQFVGGGSCGAAGGAEGDGAEQRGKAGSARRFLNGQGVVRKLQHGVVFGAQAPGLLPAKGRGHSAAAGNILSHGTLLALHCAPFQVPGVVVPPHGWVSIQLPPSTLYSVMRLACSASARAINVCCAL